MRHVINIAFAVSVLFALAGCGSSLEYSSDMTIEQLREWAGERPNDAFAQTELAFGEFLVTGGDLQRVDSQLARALELAPADERLHFVAGSHDERRGEFADALTHYLEGLTHAASSTRSSAAHTSEALAAEVVGLNEQVSGYRSRLEPFLGEVNAKGAAARHILGSLSQSFAYQAGSPADARVSADGLGCSDQWRIAGPFGPRALLDFDRELAPESDSVLADSYDLGTGRGVQPTRTHESRGCTTHLGLGNVAGAGTTYAEAAFEVVAGGPQVLRLETPNSVEVYVDGERIIRLDHRARALPRITFHEVDLAAGAHNVRVKITTRHPNPILLLSLSPKTPDDSGLALPESESVFGRFLRAELAVLRGDPITAREAIQAAVRNQAASPVMVQLAARVALSNPLRSAEQKRDEGRRLLRRVRRRDGAAWYAAYRLAVLDAEDGRALPAIEALEAAGERWPNVPRIAFAHSELLASRGWSGRADLALERARVAIPDACAMIQAELGNATRLGRESEVDALAERLVDCDARSNARYQQLMKRRAWDEAETEIDRLAALEPSQNRFGLLSARLRVARGRGDNAAVDRLLAELAADNPRAALPPLERIDRLLSEGQRTEALELLDANLRSELTAQAELHLLQRSLTGEFDLTPYRLDGATVLAAFEASDRVYDEPQVLVLDYTVIKVFEDGSSMALTHNIWRIQSEEAIDERGEFQPPDGATILQLHTVKADGRRIEPDAIAGKDTISLPSLAPGDYVEYEYVTLNQSPSAYPGGFIAPRFYFRSFETPYDVTEFVVIVPDSVEAVIDPRGPAPNTQETRAGSDRVLRWRVDESRPLRPEPGIISPREFLPSVNVGVGANWESFIEGLRDDLADRDVRDPSAVRLVRRILGQGQRGDAEFKARRIFEWVLENIEGNSDEYGVAPAMLAERTGSRSRVLRYLLNLAGIESDLVLVRSIGADQTISELAEGETYGSVVVRMATESGHVFLSPNVRGTPFGYLAQGLRGQDAIVVAESAPRITIPESAARTDSSDFTATVRMHSDGGATLEVVETHHGAPAIQWRTQLEEIPAAILEDRFEEGYVARVVAGATLDSLRITGREDAEQPLVFAYQFTVSALGHEQGTHWMVPPLFATQLAPRFAATAERALPQQVAPTIDSRVTVRLVPPAGAEPPAAPADAAVSGPGTARVEVSSQIRDGALEIERRVRVPIMRVMPADYADFARFCREADSLEAREIQMRLPD